MKLKDIKGHIKAELFVAGASGNDYLISVYVGLLYRDKRMLLLQLFEEL